MIVLDENISESQRDHLREQRFSAHQIGFDLGRKGMQDEEIVPLLLDLRRPTFFTCDAGFYNRGLCHARYAIAYLQVDEDDVAEFVRRLLRLREFNTQAKRMGTVIRVSATGISYWQKHVERELRTSWRE